MEVAHKLAFFHLMERCEEMLINNLELSNALSILNLSINCHYLTLRRFTEGFVLQHFDLIVEDPVNFVDISIEV